MFKLGPWEIALILITVLIIFGPKKLPELGKGIGEFFKNFKGGIKEKDQLDSAKSENKSDELK